MPAGDIAKLVLDILMKAFVPLYNYVKSEIDGGADAQELRNKPVQHFISFGGEEGAAVRVQREVEDEMFDPNQD